MGERGGMEEGMAREAGLRFFGIHAGKMRRYLSIRNGIDWFKIPLGTLEALLHLLRLRPACIFSKGGYVSVPVVVAGWLLRIPIVIHESDVQPGLATRLCSRFARTVCLSWEATRGHFSWHRDVRLTGVPIRAELLEGKAQDGRAHLGLTEDLPLLMVIGGSLGALDLNTFVCEALPELLPSWHVYHLTGKGKKETQPNRGTGKGRYIAQEYSDEAYADCLAAAEVIFSRAGTTALAEYDALGKKLLLCPLPADRSRGDQIDNAKSYLAKHPESTRILPQEDFATERLLADLTALQGAPLPTKHSTGAREGISALLLELHHKA